MIGVDKIFKLSELIILLFDILFDLFIFDILSIKKQLTTNNVEFSIHNKLIIIY